MHLGEALQYAKEHVFSRHSVAPVHTLLEAALVKGLGQVDLPDLKRTIEESREFVRVGHGSKAEVSTRAILESEQTLLRTVNQGVGSVAPLAPRFEAPVHLSADQRAAVAHVAFSLDRITGISGLAGTGKTTTLKAVQGMIESAGKTGVFLAPTAGAADVLKKDGFPAAADYAEGGVTKVAKNAIIPGDLVEDVASAAQTSFEQWIKEQRTEYWKNRW